LKKKMVAGMLALGLTIGAIAPVSASAQVANTVSDNTLSVNFKNVNFAALNDAYLIESYITVSDAGILVIDDDGRALVSQETFKMVQDGIDILNTSILAGNSVIDMEARSVVPVTNSSLNSGMITPYASAGTYWWGVALTMNEQEASDLIYTLRQISLGFVAEAGLAVMFATIVGGPVTWSAAAAGTLVTLGTTLVANSLEHHNNKKGVTLNIHWLLVPYYEVTKNS